MHGLQVLVVSFGQATSHDLCFVCNLLSGFRCQFSRPPGQHLVGHGFLPVTGQGSRRVSSLRGGGDCWDPRVCMMCASQGTRDLPAAPQVVLQALLGICLCLPVEIVSKIDNQHWFASLVT